MKYDVEFTVNSGDHEGDTYRYTLANVNNTKDWSVNPIFRPPPFMYKERIKMGIFAGEHNVDASGSIELRVVNQILDELSIIARCDEPATLKGLDKKDRKIRIDQDGFEIETTIKETTKEPEYKINVICWGMYDYG